MLPTINSYSKIPRTGTPSTYQRTKKVYFPPPPPLLFFYTSADHFYFVYLESATQSENGTPLGHIPLNSQILFKLKKEGSYVFIILYHAENRPIIHTGHSAREKEAPLGKSKSLDVDDLKNFVIRLHEKDESNLKRWIFTFQEAVLIGMLLPSCVIAVVVVVVV